MGITLPKQEERRGLISGEERLSVDAEEQFSQLPKEKSKIAKVVDKLNQVGNTADEAKKFLTNLNSLFVSLMKAKNGNLSEVQEAINEKIDECVKAIEGVAEDTKGKIKGALEDAAKEQLNRLRGPIREVLKTQDGDTFEVEYRGVTFSLGIKFDHTVDDAVDRAAGIIFGKIQEAEEFAKKKVDEGIKRLEMLANETTKNLLGEGDSSEDTTGALIGYQIIEYLGTSAKAAKATAKAVQLLEGIRNSGDPKLTADASLELDNIFSSHGSTVIEGKSIVDGIRMALDAGFLAEGSAELAATARAQLSEDVYAQISGQVQAYYKAAGSFSGVAKFGLFDGLELTADVSFEAQVSASASVTAEIKFGDLLMVKGDASGKVEAGANAKASGRIVIKNGEIQLQGKANFRLGAEVTATASFSVNEAFSLSVEASAIAGLAAEVGGSFSIEGGKLHLSIDLGVALGGGGGLGLDVTIDFEKILRSAAKAIEAKLLIRWQNRHLQLGTPPKLMPKEEIALTKVPARLTTPNSALFDYCLLAAKRDLPVGNDDEFLRQLELLCRGVWKQCLEKRKEEIPNESEIILEKGAIDLQASRDAESNWDGFNELLQDVVNIKYGKVILSTYNKNGPLLSTLTDLPIGNKPGSMKGNFSIERISVDIDDVASDGNFKSKGTVGSTDFTLLANIARQEKLEINSVAGAQGSIRNIASKYWEEFFELYPYDANPHSSQSETKWWEAGGHGENQNADLAKFFGKLLVAYYTVQAPSSVGESHKSEFRVKEISSSKDDQARSYIDQINGIYDKLLAPEDVEPIDATKLTLDKCKQLQTQAIPTLHRVLMEAHDADLMAKMDEFDEDSLEHIWVYVGEENPRTTIAEIAGKLKDLSTGSIATQVKRIEDARTALKNLADEIRRSYDGSSLKSDIEYNSDVSEFKLQLTELESTHSVALAVDDDKSAASTQALSFVCKELLTRPRIGGDTDLARKSSAALLKEIKDAYEISNGISASSYKSKVSAFNERINPFLENEDSVIQQNVESCKKLLKLPQRDLDLDWLKIYEATLNKSETLKKDPEEVSNVNRVKKLEQYTKTFYDEAAGGTHGQTLKTIIQNRIGLGIQDKWDKAMSRIATKVCRRKVTIVNGKVSSLEGVDETIIRPEAYGVQPEFQLSYNDFWKAAKKRAEDTEIIPDNSKTGMKTALQDFEKALGDYRGSLGQVTNGAKKEALGVKIIALVNILTAIRSLSQHEGRSGIASPDWENMIDDGIRKATGQYERTFDTAYPD